eukprot:GHUV01054087.1.p1 GENE.GHUV01054087.1~~GHUV01054087.1.p1  ORF type:complete len:111 (-),score=15.03 GHUV01054087.1:99-431(-)
MPCTSQLACLHLSETASNITLVLPCLLQIAATVFVVAWALRLGGFLVLRVWKTGHDSRFDEAKHKPFTFWIYWTMQVHMEGLELALYHAASVPACLVAGQCVVDILDHAV